MAVAESCSEICETYDAFLATLAALVTTRTVTTDEAGLTAGIEWCRARFAAALAGRLLALSFGPKVAAMSSIGGFDRRLGCGCEARGTHAMFWREWENIGREKKQEGRGNKCHAPGECRAPEAVRRPAAAAAAVRASQRQPRSTGSTTGGRRRSGSPAPRPAPRPAPQRQPCGASCPAAPR